MPPDSRIRVHKSPADGLDLPPPFRAIALREVGDAFARALAIAGQEGAGTLVHVGRFDLAEFALVLEPDEPLRTARRALYAALAALADALAAHAPPEQPINIVWPDAILIDGRLVGGGRLAWPAEADEDAPPPWLVFAATIRTVAIGGDESGLRPLATRLDGEGFVDLDSDRLIERFARHLMAAIDTWQQDGFADLAKRYLWRVAAENGVSRDIADNGDPWLRRAGTSQIERRSLAAALARPSWLDPATGGPRR